MDQSGVIRERFGSGAKAPRVAGSTVVRTKTAVSSTQNFSQGLTVETLTGVDGITALQEEYARLRGLAGIALPFVLPEWHMAWSSRFLSSSRHIKDSLLVQVVRNPSGLCVAIVPMVRTCRSEGPLAFVSFDILGADRAITEIRMPLVDPAYTCAVFQAIQRELCRRDDWDWIQWTGFDDRFAAHLATQPVWRPQEPLLDYVLDLPASWEELRKNLKRNIRESLRHCYNSLKRDGLEFTFAVVSEPTLIPGALARFLELHATRAARTDTVVHSNHFESAVGRDFLFDVCGRLAAQDRMRVFQLVIGGRVVATRIGFIVDDSLYLYYSGYDPELARYSIMTTTLAEILKYAIGQGLRTVNFSTGKDTSKLRWGPREISIPRAVQVNPRLRSRLGWEVYRRIRAGEVSSWLCSLFGGVRRSWR